jgi:uncharacterized surface protein with fasciclin (FAS1) repeats
MNLQSRVSLSGTASGLLKTNSEAALPLTGEDAASKEVALDEIGLAVGFTGEVLNDSREIERGCCLSNILDTAIAAGTFKTFVRAVETAGLASLICNGGPFTVFAPTDQAFAKFSKTELKMLLRDRPKLVATLAYHMVRGWVSAKRAARLDRATSIQGKDLKIHANGGGVTINSANVIRADLMAANGIIHAIDAVMFPDRVPASAAAGASTAARVFAA